MAQVNKVRLVLKNVRLSFAQIFEPKGFNGSEPAYSANFIVSKEDEQAKTLEQAVQSLINHQWPTNKPNLKEDKLALKNGDNVQYSGYENSVYVTSKNRKAPVLQDLDLSPVLENDNKLVSGDYVNAVIEFWAQDNNYGKRINCNLVGIQYVKQGERFGGTSSGDLFEKLSEDKKEDALDEVLDIFQESKPFTEERPKLTFGLKK